MAKQVERPTTDDAKAWHAYWQARDMPWRTQPEILAERQEELEWRRREVQPDIEQGIYPFKDVEPKLTRADIEWLLATHDAGCGPVVWAEEKDKPYKERREGLDLRGADLRREDLSGLPLTQVHGGLDSDEWFDASETQRVQARIHLEGATFNRTQLEGATLSEAHLERAYLRLVFFDAATSLKDVTLRAEGSGSAKVADVRWGGVNLAVIEWGPIIASGLGDEQAAWAWQAVPFEPDEQYKTLSRKAQAEARSQWQAKQAADRVDTFKAAVRANRQLATALRDQGMNEEADQLAYRAQMVQRQVYRQQGKRSRSLLWGFLDLVAGHGYKPGRSLLTYALVLAVFTGLYLLAGQGIITFGLPPTEYHSLPWYEALVLSVASFHGRGFFQPVQSPGDPIAILAAIEAVFGLFIEVSFIATFTQRFFGK